MPGDEAPKPQTIPVKQIHEQGIAAINLIYGAFQSVTKQNEALKARARELEAENTKLRKQLRLLQGAKELLDKFLRGDENDEESDFPSETE